MNDKKITRLHIISGYIYLFISIIIFIIGWITPYISIPLSLILILSLIKLIKNTPSYEIKFIKNKNKLIIITSIIFIWVFLSGVGGFIFQNPWDHMFRNAIFKDLVRYDWPVINFDMDNPRSLVYYIGFWLPSALIGKVFGLTSGYAFQLLWAFIGVYLSYIYICVWRKKISIWPIFLLIFFSGLDIVSYIFIALSKNIDIVSQLLSGKHIELSLYIFNNSSNTTLLFWLYNQIVPFWIGVMLVILQNNSKSLLFIYSMMFIFSPFPALALFPVILYLLIKNSNLINKFELKKLKNIFTFENTIGAISIVIIVGLFFKSNIAVNKISILPLDKITILKFIFYYILEYGVFLIFLVKNNKNNFMLHILSLSTIITSFIVMGNSYDFAWRTCIPLAFYIMLLIIKKIDDTNTNSKIKLCLILVLIVGSITPLLEIERTLIETYSYSKNNIPFRSDKLNSVFDQNPCYDNFIGSTDTLFFKYLSKTKYKLDK